jgi:putative molybdopterin biosynthesis protein
MSTKDAAEALGITLRTLYALINDGQLPAYKIGRVLRVRRVDIEAYLEGAKVQPGALDHLLPRAGRAAMEAKAGKAKKKPDRRQ